MQKLLASMTGAIVALVLGLAPQLPADGQMMLLSSAGRGAVDGGGGEPSDCEDPYPLYTTFCLEDVPWHSASGTWGAQVALVAPTAPNSSSTGHTCTTQANCQTAVNTGAREITFTTSWASSATDIQVSVDDLTLIIPEGVRIGGVIVLNGANRLRIRGSTLGTHSGGTMGRLYAPFSSSTDIHIDGIDVNGDSGSNGTSEEACFRTDGVTRIAITNVRALCNKEAMIGYGRQMVIANSHFRSAAATVASWNSAYGGGAEVGWTVRLYDGPISVVDSRLETGRFHVLRTHVDAQSNELIYSVRTKYLALAEGRAAIIGWDQNEAFSQDWRGGVFTDNDFYLHSASGGCGFQGFEADEVGYTNIVNNRWHRSGIIDFSQSNLNALDEGAEDTVAPQESFAAWTVFPEYDEPGDPRDVIMRAGLVLNSSGGEGSCSGFEDTL